MNTYIHDTDLICGYHFDDEIMVDVVSLQRDNIEGYHDTIIWNGDTYSLAAKSYKSMVTGYRAQVCNKDKDARYILRNGKPQHWRSNGIVPKASAFIIKNNHLWYRSATTRKNVSDSKFTVNDFEDGVQY
jgi:hypothetical protein